MAQRIYKQPQRGGRKEEPEIPHGIVTPSGKPLQRSSGGASGADKALSDIDKVLAESEGLRKGGVPASDLRSREKGAAGSAGSEADKAERDQVGKGYSGSAPAARHDNRFKGALNKFGKLSTRRKAMLIAGAVTGLAGLGGGLIGLFGVLNIFQLDHLLNNIEAKGFVRYQVDMEGRSNRWISAYLMLRLAEVESDLKPADRDNLIFRADSIDKTNPLYGWYKILRGSKFEEELFQKAGIKFASIACHGTIVDRECRPGGNVVRFRPAIITIKDGTVPNFNPTAAEIDALQRGDINGFNNRLRAFIDVTILNNDAEARRGIKRAIKANTKGYQVIKRYYLRKAIQNMTGVRDWRFFETKRLPCVYSPTQRQTRDECSELGKSIRNKIIAKTFPESMTGGKLVQCIFGITSCKTTTDPSNPENKSALAPLPEDCGASTNPECKTKLVDENGNPVNKDTEAVNGLEEGVGGEVDNTNNTDSLTKKITMKILTKINGPLSIVSIIDQLNIMDQNIKNGSLSSMVYMARASQAIGLFTTFGIMRDQIRTGEVQAEEVNAAMEVISNAGNSEGWQNVVAAGDNTVVSAASMETTNNKKKYCSAEFQEKMLLEENREVARSQFHWLCPGEKIGGDNLAKDIEDGWNSTVGFVLAPILAAYNATGLATIAGWVNGALDTLFNNTLGPLMEGILSAVGLDKAIEDMMAWLTSKVASVLGAGPAISEQAPAGVWANHALMGASAAAEFAARNQGAAITNETTAREATRRVADYKAAGQESMSAYGKYLSLSNPKSAASQGLFAITDGGIRQTFMATLGSIFSGSIFAPRTSAATGEAYAAANFAGLETYDFPGSCSSGVMPEEVKKLNLAELDRNDSRRNYDPAAMTPFSATNADDLGLIPAEEVSWELLGSADRFYERLYQDDYDGEKIKKVYNCTLLDSSIRGSYAAYSSALLDENAYGHGYSRTPTQTQGDTTTGTTTCPLPAYPSASCTGVPAGTNLTPYNSDTTTANGQVIEGALINGDFVVRHNNVIIRKSEIRGHIKNLNNAKYTVEDSTVGPVSGCFGDPAFRDNNYTLTRVYLRGFAEGARVEYGDNVVVQHSYFKFCNPGSDNHADALQGYRGGSNIRFEHNTVDMRDIPIAADYTTATVFWSDSSGNNVTFKDNLVSGGSYTIRIHVGTGHTVTGNKVINNSWLYGPVASNCSAIKWSNNSIVEVDAAYKVTKTVAELPCKN